MPDQVHLLVVRAGGLAWALPMASVEQTFDLREHAPHRAGNAEVVRFRGQILELVNLAQRLWLEGDEPSAAVVVWASGRRRAFAVEQLVGQLQDRTARHAAARGGRLRQRRRPARRRGHPDPRARRDHRRLVGWRHGGLGFTDLQQSALREIANIGSGHAATALSQLLGRPVDIDYSEALLTVLAEAIDRIGAPMSRSALVDTPIQAGRRHGPARLSR